MQLGLGFRDVEKMGFAGLRSSLESSFIDCLRIVVSHGLVSHVGHGSSRLGLVDYLLLATRMNRNRTKYEPEAEVSPMDYAVACHYAREEPRSLA